MTADEFVFLLLENIPTYLFGLLLSIITLLPVFKKTYKGVLDPLFYAIIMAALANAVPFFLILTSKISISSFIYIFIAETFFWIGFLVFHRKELVFKPSQVVENERADLVLFVIYFILLVVLKLTAYKLVGIPIFYEEGRLAVYTESGGLGILERLISFPVFFIAFYSFKLIERGKGYKRLALIALLALVIFSILSGSKGAILIIVGGYFYYNYFYKNNFIEFKKFIKYIPILLTIPIAILVLQTDGTGFNPLIGLLFRFIANGDIYYMSFPNDLINIIHINNKFTYLFSGLLSPFRLIDIQTVDTVIGFQFNWDLHPLNEGSLSGPNTRIPVLSWIFYGWAGIFFSFLIGFILSFIYNQLSMFLSKGIISYILIAYIQYNLLISITDPVLGIGFIFDFILNMTIFFLLYFLTNKKILIIHENE